MIEDFDFNTYMRSELDSRSLDRQSDELVFRKARIYDRMKTGDDRLRVQLVPEQLDVPSNELDDLPVFPMFYRGTYITGKTVKEDGDSADYVWVVCTPDAQVGFILGLANQFEDPNRKYSLSYGYSDIKSFLKERSVDTTDFNYEDLHIIEWFYTKGKGGLLVASNRKTGDFLILNTSGTIFSMQQKKIYMRVGSPSPGGTGSGFSSLTITASAFKVQTPSFEVDAQNMTLGRHGMCLAAAPSPAPIIGKNGVVYEGISTIQV